MLDAVHDIENILVLQLDLHTQGAPHILQILNQHFEGFGGFGNIHNHHHVEVALDNRLGDVQNIDVVLSQVRADLGNNANLVFSQYGNNAFHAYSLLNIRSYPFDGEEPISIIMSNPGAGSNKMFFVNLNENLYSGKREE
jgi:hypothetical protein